jgi:hypothetical protein
MKENPNYYAVIPASVRYDKNLKANEKLLFGEITCLTQSTGLCFASNEYFANLYGTTKETVSRWVSSLEGQGYIITKMEYKPGTKQILKRYIQINQYPIDENINTPIDEKVNNPIDENIKDNTTRTNTTSINKGATRVNLEKPENVSDQVWQDFNRQRKSRITQTALNGIIKQANTAGWTLEQALTEAVERGWQSFKAEWVNKPRYQQDNKSLTDIIEGWHE